MDTPMDNQQERLSLEFLAGLIVGEGCFSLGITKPTRSRLTRHFALVPMFALSMDDEESMVQVIESWKLWGLPCWVHRTKRGALVAQTKGLLRVKRVIEILLPYLTGEKLHAALLVKQFIQLRESKEYNASYGPEEFAIVEKLRETNNSGKRLQNPQRLYDEYQQSVGKDKVQASRET